MTTAESYQTWREAETKRLKAKPASDLCEYEKIMAYGQQCDTCQLRCQEPMRWTTSGCRCCSACYRRWCAENWTAK